MPFLTSTKRWHKSCCLTPYHTYFTKPLLIPPSLQKYACTDLEESSKSDSRDNVGVRAVLSVLKYMGVHVAIIPYAAQLHFFLESMSAQLAVNFH